jgi:hypothetical protein
MARGGENLPVVERSASGGRSAAPCALVDTRIILQHQRDRSQKLTKPEPRGTIPSFLESDTADSQERTILEVLARKKNILRVRR